MLSHVGRQTRGHLLQLRVDNQSPCLGQGSAVLTSGVETIHPDSGEGAEINLGLPPDGYRTIGDIDLGQRSEHNDDATSGVDYPSEHVDNLGGG